MTDTCSHCGGPYEPGAAEPAFEPGRLCPFCRAERDGLISEAQADDRRALELAGENPMMSDYLYRRAAHRRNLARDF